MNLLLAFIIKNNFNFTILVSPYVQPLVVSLKVFEYSVKNINCQ